MGRIPTTYWRLNYASDDVLNEMISSLVVITVEKDFILGLRVGDGVLLAKFDESSATGKVRAIGIVADVNGKTSLPQVIWRRVSETLYPSVQGQKFWRQPKPYFKFAKNVAKRYRLPEIFQRNFSDLTVDAKQPAGGHASQSTTEKMGTGGYVYVIKSQYGYKIGKTKRMKDRAQLFSVKLPFPIEVVHYAWFHDYSAAEHLLHQMFQAKRMEGEWFRLTEADLTTIKRFKRPLT